ncbi:thioredoxin family protein [Paenibacillus gyeongsangnamensis]|uniref:thioredoxin family protein n=1 Tax=Paenibacillus gyeongsangnamensis TaxID=3388067 RepID=UPI0039081AEE
MRPVVSKVSEQETDVDFYYVDVDQSSDLASQFDVRSIPTMVLIKNGKETNRSVGFIPEAKVKEFAHS